MDAKEGVMEDKIKVLYITTLFGKMGGAERNLYDIVTNIDRERFVPYIFCLKGGELVGEVTVRGIFARELQLEKIFSLDAARKGIDLFRFIREEGIKVVVTYHHDADIWGGIVAMLAGVPVVISSRRDLGYQLERRHIWVYRLLNRLYTGIISVSDAVKDAVVQREWAPANKITTLYNGLDITGYQPTPSTDEIRAYRESLGINPNRVVIGMVAAFRPVKGHIHLVKAVAEVVRKHPNIQLVVVGYKDTEYYQVVAELIRNLGMEDHVICLGDRKDIPRLLFTFDIFALPSESEGFSNALLEAMAAGRPTVDTKTGGNAEAVIDGITGFLVPPKDHTALAEALAKLVENPGLRYSMGQEGQRRVAEVFTLGAMLARTEEFYDSLLIREAATEKLTSRVNFRTAKRLTKIIISYILYYSGIVGACKTAWAMEPKVLAYHSISAITLPSLEIEQEPASFEQQVRYLIKNYRVISADDFLRCRADGGNFPKNAVMITFDDGYRDNYVNAFPILKKYSAPAVIFLTTDPIETGEPLFYDALRQAITNTSRRLLDLRESGLRQYAIEPGNDLLNSMTVREIIALSKTLDKSKKDRLIDTIRQQLDVNGNHNNRIYLSWDEIAEMSAHGIEFGGHTKSHPQLSRLAYEECRHELETSKQIIEQRLGKKVRMLAYPFGSKNDYNAVTEKAAMAAGYVCAFALSRQNCAINSAQFTIGRTMVDASMSSSLTGGFCKPVFAADLVGVYR